MRVAMRPAVAGLLMSIMIGASQAPSAETLTLASGRSDAAAYAAGVGLSSLIKFELLPTDKIDLQAIESGGVVDNIRLMQAGDAEFAIVPSIIGHSARLGTGSFAGDPPETGLRAIATLWRDALHLVVRADKVATGTIDDLSHLPDGRLFLGDEASGMVDANRLLLADLGLEAGRGFAPATVDGGDAIAAIKRGEIDAFSAAARPPAATFEAVFEQPSSGLKLLDVTEVQLTRANGNHWLWTPYVIPAATYAGQQEDVWTMALSNLLVVRADVDDEVVYAITRSLFENLPYLKRVDPVMADLSLDQALAGMTMPLHPGALRYFQEAGLISRPGSERNPDAGSPAVMPVRQNEDAPATMPERYPDADVAGEWPAAGVGGPLLKTSPATTAPPVPGGGRDRPEPFWKRRATL